MIRMTNTKALVHRWFEVWRNGDFENIPVSEDFKHTSPYGTIEGKKAYFSLIDANRDKFLGNIITIHDEVYEENRASIRYTVAKDDFSMEVSEWVYTNGQLITQIIAYYNIEGEISEGHQLKGLG